MTVTDITSVDKQRTDTEVLDVLIVGAGLAGINTAYRIQQNSPGLKFQIVERRDAVGGTWNLFKYPGIRSDSDIFTLSYPFLAWKKDQTMAQGAEIQSYIAEAVEQFHLDKQLTFGVSVNSANFDTATNLWTVDAEINGKAVVYTTRFLMMCTGYYNYAEAYTPEFPGQENFTGQVVHPQFWPEGLDYQNKKVAVIGSGATAITLIPSMADDVERITMVQRSPTYIVSLPSTDPFTVLARRVLPNKAAHQFTRWRNALVNLAFYQYCRRAPKLAKRTILTQVKAQLPKGYPVNVHFNPRYKPWDQRLCVVPNGDLFRAIRKGQAEVVTGVIKEFTATGLTMTDGTQVEADIIITATGLQVQSLGGIDLTVDGGEIKAGDHFSYRGYMLEGLPNAAWTFGYTNASWTLRADITARAVARTLNYMRDHGFSRVTPERGDELLVEDELLDLQSGYVQRAAGTLPKAATKAPWKARQNFLLDTIAYHREEPFEGLVFEKAAVKAS